MKPKEFKASQEAALKKCRDIGNIRRAKFARAEVRHNRCVAVCFVTGVTKKDTDKDDLYFAGWKELHPEYSFKIDDISTIYFRSDQPAQQALRIEQSLFKRDINAILGFAPANYNQAASLLFKHWYDHQNFDLPDKTLGTLRTQKRIAKAMIAKSTPTSVLISELAVRLKRAGFRITNSPSQLEADVGWRIRIDGVGAKRAWRSRGLDDASINGLLVRRYDVEFVYGVLTGYRVDRSKNVMDAGWNMVALSKALTLKNISHNFHRAGRNAKDSVATSLFRRAGAPLWSVALKRSNRELVWQVTGFRVSVPKNTTLEGLPLATMLKLISKRERRAAQKRIPSTNPYVLLRNQARSAMTELHEKLEEMDISSKKLVSGMELLGDNFRVRLSHAFPQHKRKFRTLVPKLYWYIEFNSAYGHFQQWSLYDDYSVKHFSATVRTLLTKAELLGQPPVPEEEVKNYLPQSKRLLTPEVTEVELFLRERSRPVAYRRVGEMLCHSVLSPIVWSLGIMRLDDVMWWRLRCGTQDYLDRVDDVSSEMIGQRIIRHIEYEKRRKTFVTLGGFLAPRPPGLQRWFTQADRFDATHIRTGV